MTQALADDPPDAVPWSGSILPARRLDAAVWAFVALGVAIRALRYLLNYPLWGDESYLAVNFIGRGYRDLLRPLDYHQVAPLLFLWAERTAVKWLGFSEWSLRLFPALCAAASVVLFRHAAGLVLRGLPRLLAVATFAVAYYPIRHAAEVKPYASDLLVALALLTLALEWLREPGRTRWGWSLAAVAPVAVGLSHPAVFMAGGIGLALAPMAWRTRRSGGLAPWLAFGLATAATFLAMYVLFTADQVRDAAEGGMPTYWAGAFPPRTGLLPLAGWLADVHTGHMFAYPAGGARGLSGLTVACVGAAVIALMRRRRWAVLALLLAPFGLNLLAAAGHAYPYGRSPRIMQYAAPATCLLAGLGAAVLLAMPRSPRRRERLAIGTLALLGGIGATLMVGQIVSPGRSYCDQRTREFARWFWSERGRVAEIACLKSDFGLTFDRRHWEYGRSALYLCNQRIYSDRHRRGLPPVWDRVSATHPLLCVLFNESPRDDPAFRSWLEGMAARYDLHGHSTFDVNAGTGRVGGLEDRYEVFEFVPRSRTAADRIAAGATLGRSR